MTPLLSITDLCVAVTKKPIIQGLSLTINEGEIHAIMGPNGSGKSTLVNTLMGHPSYEVMSGSVLFRGEDLLAMKTDERARKGLFLAFQYPREIAGVTLRSFLFAASKACQRDFSTRSATTLLDSAAFSSSEEPGAAAEGDESRSTRPHSKKTLISPIKFKKHLEAAMQELRMDPTFAERAVNEGWSGGEKKKAEVLQLTILRPLLALLDETDSGLDIDALKIVAEGVMKMRSPTFSALLVTHYARILHHLTPEKIHVMVAGKIVASGGAELAQQLEKDGYAKYEHCSSSPSRVG